MSHTSHDTMRELVSTIRNVESSYSRPIGILVDLQGPKLRLGAFAEGATQLKNGQSFTLDSDKAPGDNSRVHLPHPEILAALRPGHALLLDDGKVRLSAEETTKEHAVTRVVVGGRMSDRKGVSLPDTDLPVSAMTPKWREQSSIGRDHATCLLHLLGGQVHEAGKHLSRIYAFDLFCGNWDRHPGNYLILNETSALVVFAIDFSHAPMHPGCAMPGFDPLILLNSATRVWFKTVVAPYGQDVASATETVDRLAKLPVAEIEAILTSIPLDWLSPADRDGIIVWWRDGGRKARADLLLKGLKDGTYI
jgi:Pyruvate kinase, barrel domain